MRLDRPALNAAIRPAADHARPVGRKCHRDQVSLVRFELHDQCRGKFCDIPQFDPAASISSAQQSAVWRECQTLNLWRMYIEQAQRMAVGLIEKADELVVAADRNPTMSAV